MEVGVTTFVRITESDGYGNDNDIATLRSTVDAWNLPATRLDVMHQTYIDSLRPAKRAAIEDVLRARLALVGQP